MSIPVRRRFMLPLQLLLIALAPAGLTAAAAERAVYQVGLARVDITPTYSIRLNGFGFRRDESEGVSQRIYARAMAISQGAQPPLVLVAIDSLGVRMSMVDEIAKQLKQSHDLPRANLALTFTHSHCAPKVNGASDNIFSQAIPNSHQKHIDRYTVELRDAITKAARQAIEGRQASHLEWNQGRVGFAKNRRTAGGPVDHQLPVLLVRNAENGQVRGVYVSYACHCVTLSFNRISGDWAGYAAEIIERTTPGAIALVSIGCGSDSNPDSGVTGDKTDVAARQGGEIASEVTRIMKAKNRPLSGSLSAKLNTLKLPYQPIPSVEQYRAMAKKGGAAGYNASTQLAKLGRGEKIATTMNYPIQSWTIDDQLCIVFLAGEVCVDYALRLKKQLRRDRVWLNGYSNDFCSYIPSERLVREGGYGGGAEIPYFALPTRLAAGLEQSIVEEVLRQTPNAFRALPGTQGVPPKEPEESLQCLQTHDDLRVEIVAAEPLVSDPVAIDFGPDGRVWVAEMNDYGQGVAAKFKHTGRIRCLSDSDRDGKLDQAITFVDGLRFPTDVKVWKNGLLICDAPRILFAEDTDGDGVADVKRTLFSGFEVHNAQARVNSLRFGLDNWIHGSCGLFGGAITSVKTGRRVAIANRDFRLNVETGEIEATTGRTQQGRCRNDWGDWFGCTNGSLLIQHLGQSRYAGRNPLVAPPSASANLGDAPALELFHRGDLVRFKLSGPTGRATSACGLGIYRDKQLGRAYQGNAFTCEPVHQLVHRMVLERNGVHYLGKRAENEVGREFLSSTDPWFRPVQVRTAPDGSLWVVDMYRYVIEHSRWIPPETLAELDVYAGQGRGRIYRVSSKHQLPASGSAPKISEQHGADLVQLLQSPNGMVRDLAHQRLIHDEGPPPIEELKVLLAATNNPMAQIHLLSVLRFHQSLNDSQLLQALQSRHPQVLRHAIEHSESRLDDAKALQVRVLELASHPDAMVRRQTAWSLGECEAFQRNPVVALRLLGDSESRVRAAAYSSLNAQNIAAVVRAGLEQSARLPSAETTTLLRVGLQLGDDELLDTILARICTPQSDESLLRLAQAERYAELVNALRRRSDDTARRVQEKWAPQFERVQQMAINTLRSSDDDASRLAALSILGSSAQATGAPIPVSKSNEILDDIAQLISAANSTALQQAAVNSLGARPDAAAAQHLIRRLPHASGTIRASILDALLRRDAFLSVLLDALEKGVMPVATLDATRRQRLLTHKAAALRNRAKQILQVEHGAGARDVVLNEYRRRMDLELGNAATGLSAFKKHCSACHRLNEIGFNVGPNLAALTNLSVDGLLTAVLDPNREVDARYVSWSAILTDGRSISGVLVEETAVSITLREAGGKDHVILRSQIDELRTQGKSTMPEGFERDVSTKDMADILKYLQQLEPPPKSLPGNHPKRIVKNDRDEYSLVAAHAEIRGGSIVFEQPFQNIGHWHAERDRATWRVDVSNRGEFDVYLQVACANASAGNRFRIDGLGSIVRGVAPATGGWNRFRTLNAGRVSIEAGLHTVTIRPDGALQRALFDLREVRLVPAGKATTFAPVSGS